MSPFWRAALRLQYRLLALIDPIVRTWWKRHGLGNVVELRVARRNSGAIRSRMIGTLTAGGREYVGHPNGDAGWTRDLEAAGVGVLVLPGGGEIEFRATRLAAGDERERAIRATSQHPFPGNLVYRLSRRHVRAVGVYFRVEPIEAAAAP